MSETYECNVCSGGCRLEVFGCDTFPVRCVEGQGNAEWTKVAPAKDAACIELLKVQAECWEKVFLHCCDLGMDPYGGGLPIDDVCDFIGLTDSKEGAVG